MILSKWYSTTSVKSLPFPVHSKVINSMDVLNPDINYALRLLYDSFKTLE
jgi:hypothetical protein